MASDDPVEEQKSVDGIVDSRIYSLSSQWGTSLNGSKNSSVTFKLEGFTSGTPDISLVTFRLRSAIIPNLFYNVTNVTLSFLYSSDSINETISISIVDGIYNINTLITAVNTQIRAYFTALDGQTLGSFLSCAYNSITNRIQFTLLSAPSASSNAVFAFIPTAAAFKYFGFGQTTMLIISWNNYLAGTNSPDLSGVTSIYIQSLEIPSQNYSTELGANVVDIIPIASGSPLSTVYQFNNRNGFMIPVSVLMDRLTILMYDQNKNFIDFQNLNWSLTFEINYYKTGVPIYEDFHSTLERLIQQTVQTNNQQQSSAQPEGDYLSPSLNLTDEQLQQFLDIERPEIFKHDFLSLLPSTDV